MLDILWYKVGILGRRPPDVWFCIRCSTGGQDEVLVVCTRVYATGKRKPALRRVCCCWLEMEERFLPDVHQPAEEKDSRPCLVLHSHCLDGQDVADDALEHDDSLVVVGE